MKPFTLFSQGLVTRKEFEQLVAASDRLRALGILREDGGIDYGLALEVLALARNDGFCRYYLGLREGNKPCEWIYLSRETLELLKETKLKERQAYPQPLATLVQWPAGSGSVATSSITGSAPQLMPRSSSPRASFPLSPLTRTLWSMAHCSPLNMHYPDDIPPSRFPRLC